MTGSVVTVGTFDGVHRGHHAVLAEIHRRAVSSGRRSMLVSAEDTSDLNGRPLTFEWSLLQGDPAKVRIEPLGDGASARITLDWHDPFRISEENPVVSSRIDVGVFAPGTDNMVVLSG